MQFSAFDPAYWVFCFVLFFHLSFIYLFCGVFCFVFRILLFKTRFVCVNLAVLNLLCRSCQPQTQRIACLCLLSATLPALLDVFPLTLQSLLWPWRGFTLQLKGIVMALLDGIHLMVLIQLESGYLVPFILLVHEDFSQIQEGT